MKYTIKQKKTLDIDIEEISFSCNNWDKAFAKNEFCSTQKKLRFHATIETKHLPKISFEVLRRN